jgi:tetratricopeptide (TPR) repeat protein
MEFISMNPTVHKMLLPLFTLLMLTFLLIGASYAQSQYDQPMGMGDQMGGGLDPMGGMGDNQMGGGMQSPQQADTNQQNNRLSEALESYKRGDFLRTSLLLYDIISEKEVASNPVDEQAEYTLGKTFYRLNLYQASFEFFARVVKAGKQHRYFRTTCKWLYYLSRKIPGDDELLKRIASYEPHDCMEFNNEVSFLRGQYHYKRGELEEALKYLGQVSRDNVLFLKSTFLRGVTYRRLNDIKSAIKTFAQILRYTVESFYGIKNEKEAAMRKLRMRNQKEDNINTARLIDKVAQGDYKKDLKYFSQLAILNMARLLYEQNNNRKAVRYYDYMPINGYFWLEALFESSWALFRMGPRYHEKALGNLQTLSSPFFIDEYTPEAPILKAVILYSRCDYQKSLTAVAEFRRVYEPLLNELDGYIRDFSDPKKLYDFLRRIQKGSANSQRVVQILNALFDDRELKRVNAHISEMERELKVIQLAQSTWSNSDLANYVIQTIEFTKDLAFDKAGEMAKNRLARIVEELRDLQGKADAIDVEVATAEQSDSKLSLSGVDIKRNLLAEAKKRTPDAEHIYWTFEGEYWRDELGYYLYSIQSKCGR